MYIELEERDGVWPCYFSTPFGLGGGMGRLNHIGGDIQTQPGLVSSQSAGIKQKSEISEFWSRSGQSGRQHGTQLWSPATDAGYYGDKALRESAPPSPLHEPAIFKSNLPCNEFHVMSFKNNSKTCDFMKRKIKDADRGFLLLSACFGLCVIK